MTKRIRLRLVVTLLIAALSVFLFAGFPPSVAHMKERVHLGLDLSGGMHLVLQVVTDDAVRADTDQAIETAQSLLQKEGISFRSIVRTDNDRFVVSGLDSGKASIFRSVVMDGLKDWELKPMDVSKLDSVTLVMTPATVEAVRNQSVEQAMDTIRNRIDQLGVVDPTIQRYRGADPYEILVQLPGVQDFARVKEVMQLTAVLELKLVDSGPYANLADATRNYGGAIPENLEVLPSQEGAESASNVSYYVVQSHASIRGGVVKNAYPSRDENGLPAVTFALNAEGAESFGRVTEQNIGKRLAIVLDRKIQTAPVIHTRISDSAVIQSSGGFRPQEAADLALILRSGALPASIVYAEESFVGPSLGKDSIRAGILSAAVALLLVVAFMLFYYRLSGVNATVAMILNLVILLGAMAHFGATLTLPGIAGIILTIGVGIDSNVLIFERIREELRAGKTAVSAIDTGFGRVWITLVDTHLAALISAGFLFLFGTGPVKGFAVTLVIGLVSNMFTAVFVSRTLFDWVLHRQKGGASISI